MESAVSRDKEAISSISRRSSVGIGGNGRIGANLADASIPEMVMAVCSRLGILDKVVRRQREGNQE